MKMLNYEIFAFSFFFNTDICFYSQQALKIIGDHIRLYKCVLFKLGYMLWVFIIVLVQTGYPGHIHLMFHGYQVSL